MAEQPLTFLIHDKHGCTYRLVVAEGEHDFCSYLHDNQNTAGRLNVDFASPDEWEIADLVLFEKSPQAVNWFFRLLRDFTSWKPKVIDYRFRGLGAALLQFVEEQARQRNIKRVVGKVVRRDYNDWPELLNWYAKRGFTVTPRNDDDASDTVARISKEMHP